MVLLAATAVLSGCQIDRPPLTQQASPTSANSASASGPRESCLVTYVTDGDTIRCRTSAGLDLGRVRIVGIDAPEIRHGSQPTQCHADAAWQALRALVDGRTVELTPDPSQGDRDRYGRLLRSVSVAGSDVGLTLLGAGDVRLYRQARHPQVEQYTQAAARAREDGRGLWGACPA